MRAKKRAMRSEAVTQKVKRQHPRAHKRVLMSQNILDSRIDLGNTPEMFAAYAHFGRLSPDETFGALHGSLHHVMAGHEEIDPKWMEKIAAEAKRFYETFGKQLSQHEKWILQQLQLKPKD